MAVRESAHLETDCFMSERQQVRAAQAAERRLARSNSWGGTTKLERQHLRRVALSIRTKHAKQEDEHNDQLSKVSDEAIHESAESSEEVSLTAAGKETNDVDAISTDAAADDSTAPETSEVDNLEEYSDNEVPLWPDTDYEDDFVETTCSSRMDYTESEEAASSPFTPPRKPPWSGFSSPFSNSRYADGWRADGLSLQRHERDAQGVPFQRFDAAIHLAGSGRSQSSVHVIGPVTATPVVGTFIGQPQQVCNAHRGISAQQHACVATTGTPPPQKPVSAPGAAGTTLSARCAQRRGCELSVQTNFGKANIASTVKTVRDQKVFVGGVPPEMTQDRFYALFKDLAPVKKAWLQTGPENDANSSDTPLAHRGFGFVIFRTGDAVTNLLGQSASCFITMSDGTQLEVKRAISSSKLNSMSTNVKRSQGTEQASPKTPIRTLRAPR